jgi:anti-anti-sigma factor
LPSLVSAVGSVASIEHAQARTLREPSFAIAVSRAGDSCSLVVSGELDMATAPRLRAALDAELERDASMVVDLASLDFIDMAGLRALLDAAAHAGANGRRFDVLNPSPAVDRLLELTGLGRRLSIRRA